MHSLICFTLLFTSWFALGYFYTHATKAQQNNSQQDKKYQAVLLKLSKSQKGLACPAFTDREKKFNDEVSVTRKSVFLREIYDNDESENNITLNICNNPPQPAIVYDSNRSTYEIGWEFYYEEGRITQLEDDGYGYNPLSVKYVNINNQSIPLGKLVSDRQDGKNTKFIFTDGSTPLIFHWISELLINSLGHNKQIKWVDAGLFFDTEQFKCQDYQLDKWEEINVKIHSHSESWSASEESKNSAEQSFGVLKKSRIIPIWYFDTCSGKLASSVDINVILVWKGIADGQLKKVDLFIAAVIDSMRWCRDDIEVIFGVSGEYERRITYPLDTAVQKIPIPKIIHRLIKGTFDFSDYIAVIIIHNEPAYVPDSDRLCNNDTMLSGWDMILNDDPKTGLTYVCELTREIENKLGIGIRRRDASPLQLDAVPYSEYPSWDYTYPIVDHDLTDSINNECESLWRKAGI